MSTNTTPAIDIYTYPESATPLELARYQVAVMEAHERGEVIEYSHDSGASWRALTWSGWDFLWINDSARKYRYRSARPKPAPTKKLVPWTFETAPKGCVLIRTIGTPSKYAYVSAVFEWNEEGICGGNNRRWPYGDLMKYCEHSTDSGATWQPCGTEVSP